MGVLDSLRARAQQRVVCEHGANAYHDGSGGGAPLVDVLARGASGDPLGVPRAAGDLAVEGHGVFHGDVGGLVRDVVHPCAVERSALVCEHSLEHLDAGLAQRSNALAGNQRVGVCRTHHHAGDARVYERLGAGGLLALVAAGLERHVHRGPRGVDARAGAACQGFSLCVQLAVCRVPALCDDCAVAHDDGSDLRVGGHPARSPGSQCQGSPHVRLMIHMTTFFHPDCTVGHGIAPCLP